VRLRIGPSGPGTRFENTLIERVWTPLPPSVNFVENFAHDVPVRIGSLADLSLPRRRQPTTEVCPVRMSVFHCASGGASLERGISGCAYDVLPTAGKGPRCRSRSSGRTSENAMSGIIAGASHFRHRFGEMEPLYLPPTRSSNWASSASRKVADRPACQPPVNDHAVESPSFGVRTVPRRQQQIKSNHRRVQVQAFHGPC